MEFLISANTETRETRETIGCHFPWFICVVWDFHKPSWKKEKMGGWGGRHHIQQSWPHSLYFCLGASVNNNVVNYRFYHYVMVVIFTEHLLQTIICATRNRQMSLYYYSGQLSWQTIYLWVCLYTCNCYVNLTVKIIGYKSINASTPIIIRGLTGLI